jgi:hypothetical protein
MLHVRLCLDKLQKGSSEQILAFLGFSGNLVRLYGSLRTNVFVWDYIQEQNGFRLFSSYCLLRRNLKQFDL